MIDFLSGVATVITVVLICLVYWAVVNHDRDMAREDWRRDRLDARLRRTKKPRR